MENRCCVLGCLSTSNNGVRLHKFPFDNQVLLPIWIMVTNRIDWLPNIKSRICDRHFSISDYEDGNKNNNLKSNACPLFNTPSNNIENDKVMTYLDVSDVEISSTSDINFSDLDTDDLLDTPNTSDMQFSDDDSIMSSSSKNSKKTRRMNNKDFLPALSYNQTEGNTMDDRNANHKTNTVPLSSTVTSFENIDCLNDNKCAVVLCNENVRLQFDQLFFIDFPKDKKLCSTWWKMCGRINKFDSSFKICSIHFDVNDFKTVFVKQDNQISQQTVLKNINIVPTHYLLPHEYTTLSRKRKRTIDDNSRTTIQNKSAEIVNCSIQGCKKTSLQDSKRIFFFKFPLENKIMLGKWLNNIGVPNWQPSDTDMICSDHFECYNINQINDSDSNCDHELQKHTTSTVNTMASRNPLLNSKHGRNMLGYSSVEGKEFNFENLNEDISMVKKNDGEKSILYDLPRNKVNHKQIVTTATNQSDLIERNTIKEKQLLNPSTQSNKSNDHLESFIMDIFNSDNDEGNLFLNDGLQSQNETTLSISKQNLESFEKEISEEINIIPKSKNNGNDRDYIYLDMLNGDDVGQFLSIEKIYIGKSSMLKLPELLEKKPTKGIPKSIIYDSDLTECYGEMLPATCDTDCQLICYYLIPGPQRRDIYIKFQMMNNVTEQNCKITELVKLRMIKKRDEKFECCPLYHLIMNNLSIKVCRTFFINTLGITEDRLNGVLKPINYSWYSDKETAMNANLPKHVKVTGESVVMTDFMKESLKLLDKDYNLYELESDSEVNLDNVPYEEYEKVITYMKSIPRVLSSCEVPGEPNKQFFETSICFDYIFKIYSENYIKNKVPPPYTKCQFKIIYNQYMKTFLKMV